MKFRIMLSHLSPTDAALRTLYRAADGIRGFLPIDGRPLVEAVAFLQRLGSIYSTDSEMRLRGTAFQAFLEFEYMPEDWEKCELFEADFHRLADNGVEVRYPLPMDGSAKIVLETMNRDLPEFVLAGANGFAFVRDAVKVEMEREKFGGIDFQRAGILGYKRGPDETESGEGAMLKRTPGKGESLWQIRSTVALPTPVAVPAEKRTHRPLAGRVDLPEGMRTLGVVEDRLVFARDSLANMGPFDIAALTQPPRDHRGQPSGSPPRIVVSRRLKDWLTKRLRPTWKAELERDKLSGVALGFSPEWHEKWKPVTIVEG